MYKVHDGCCLELKEVAAIWSEKYSDPKLDQECYLVRVFLKNNSSILTIANYPNKIEADSLIKLISKKQKETSRVKKHLKEIS